MEITDDEIDAVWESSNRSVEMKYAENYTDLRNFARAILALEKDAALPVVPEGWRLVPTIGTMVKAGHPITCLNPDEYFEVKYVRAELGGNFAVRGDNTCWFGLRSITAAPQPGNAPPPAASGYSFDAMPPEIEGRMAVWLTLGKELHPQTVNLVVRFARALAAKLADAEKKYGYSDGWRSADWMGECRSKLLEHVAKGDPRDVAAYCAFLWHHGERTAMPTLAHPATPPDAGVLREALEALDSATAWLEGWSDVGAAKAPYVAVKASIERIRAALSGASQPEGVEMLTDEEIRDALDTPLCAIDRRRSFSLFGYCAVIRAFAAKAGITIREPGNAQQEKAND